MTGSWFPLYFVLLLCCIHTVVNVCSICSLICLQLHFWSSKGAQGRMALTPSELLVPGGPVKGSRLEKEGSTWTRGRFLRTG